jgi:hypothetical protein
MESIGQPLPFATGHRHNLIKREFGGFCVRALPDKHQY